MAIYTGLGVPSGQGGKKFMSWATFGANVCTSAKMGQLVLIAV